MREVRTFIAGFRASGGDPDEFPRPFVGRAAVFGARALIGAAERGKGFVEIIDVGAFDKVLDGDVRLLQNHDPNRVLARTASGTLRLKSSKHGLETEADLPDVSYARDLAVLMDRGDVTQMSFSFNARGGDTWAKVADDDPEFAGMDMRTIHEVKSLHDVSVVTYPAYAETSASMRSAIDELLADVPKEIVEARSVAAFRLRELTLKAKEAN